MDFKQALNNSLKIDKHTHNDSFLLYSRVCDFVGDDYEAKKAAEDFYRLEARYEISKSILAAAPQLKRRKRAKHTRKLKPMAPPPDNAYVFYTNDSPIIHISGECVCLKNKMVFRTTYNCVKYVDFKKYRHGHHLNFHRLHSPKELQTLSICRCCGNFKPIYPQTLIEKFRAFLYNVFGIGGAIQ